MIVQHPTLNAQRSRGLNRLTLTLWGARLGCTVRTLWQLEGRWCRGRCFDKLSMTDRGGGHGAAGWDSRPYQRQDAADKGASKTCILRNEPICNVEENAFIWFGENGLHRLQKNDKWVRFFTNERFGEDANTPHPNPRPPRGEGRGYHANSSGEWVDEVDRLDVVDDQRTDTDLHGRGKRTRRSASLQRSGPGRGRLGQPALPTTGERSKKHNAKRTPQLSCGL